GATAPRGTKPDLARPRPPPNLESLESSDSSARRSSETLDAMVASTRFFRSTNFSIDIDLRATEILPPIEGKQSPPIIHVNRVDTREKSAAVAKVQLCARWRPCLPILSRVGRRVVWVLS